MTSIKLSLVQTLNHATFDVYTPKTAKTAMGIIAALDSKGMLNPLKKVSTMECADGDI